MCQSGGRVASNTGGTQGNDELLRISLGEFIVLIVHLQLCWEHRPSMPFSVKILTSSIRFIVESRGHLSYSCHSSVLLSVDYGRAMAQVVLRRLPQSFQDSAWN